MYCNTSEKYGTFNRKHRVLWPLDFQIQKRIVSVETIWGNTVYVVFLPLLDFSKLILFFLLLLDFSKYKKTFVFFLLLLDFVVVRFKQIHRISKTVWFWFHIQSSKSCRRPQKLISNTFSLQSSKLNFVEN